MLILSTSLHEEMRFFSYLSRVRLLLNTIRLQKVMCVPKMGRMENLSDYFFLFWLVVGVFLPKSTWRL